MNRDTIRGMRAAVDRMSATQEALATAETLPEFPAAPVSGVRLSPAGEALEAAQAHCESARRSSSKMLTTRVVRSVGQYSMISAERAVK